MADRISINTRLELDTRPTQHEPLIESCCRPGFIQSAARSQVGSWQAAGSGPLPSSITFNRKSEKNLNNLTWPVIDSVGEESAQAEEETMENFSFCSTLKSCIARDFEGGLAVHKMCTLTLQGGQSWPWPRAAYIHTGRGLIQYFPFKFQCRAPGTSSLGRD